MNSSNDQRNFGLKDQYLKEIKVVMSSYPEIEKVVVFGSRAKGNYQRGSDIDLALYGDLDMDQISRIEQALNENTHIPLFFDVVGFQLLTSTSLREHITRAGREL